MVIDKKHHEKYMERCLELASLAAGNTYPNPMVGSVIVYNDNIIGEGYHIAHGEKHAEANAIESVKDRSLLKKSTLYVNLEPCSHYGKTPPCADRIVEEGIPEVVVGTLDTSGKVSGKGVKIMKEAGCKVTIGVLEEACRELNKRFFCYYEQGRPYIILKWAQSQDGYIDKKREPDDPIAPNWITDNVARRLVHKWRTQESAILVGSKTAIKDNPQLNVREWSGKNPLRFVLDKDFEINQRYKLIYDNDSTIIFVDKTVDNKRLDKYADYETEFIKLDYNGNLLKQVSDYLYSKGIMSVIIEGGAVTLESFLNANLWDEARVFVGEMMFFEGVKAPPMPLVNPVDRLEYKNSVLCVFRRNFNT
ncbi:MAG: bifunctional diaminohydroxyphosphoribosylaminopyrimidine deaminase/5-amino-6-(5-phosphoribosylamino)uracil reductase RibD [Bacteroidales bacterium]